MTIPFSLICGNVRVEGRCRTCIVGAAAGLRSFINGFQDMPPIQFKPREPFEEYIPASLLDAGRGCFSPDYRPDMGA